MPSKMRKLHTGGQLTIRSNCSFIVGIGVGDLDHALVCQKNHADFLVLYNFFQYRREGVPCGVLAGYLPYGDANQQVLDISETLAPAIEIPVFAGVCGNDPFRVPEVYVNQLKRNKIAGVHNFPTVCLIDGTFIRNLEETGMGYSAEVSFLRKAKDEGLMTVACVTNKDQISRMVKMGADMLLYLGLSCLTNENHIKKVEMIQEYGTIAREAKKLHGDVKMLFSVDSNMPLCLVGEIIDDGAYDGLIDMNVAGQMEDMQQIEKRIAFYKNSLR